MVLSTLQDWAGRVGGFLTGSPSADTRRPRAYGTGLPEPEPTRAARLAAIRQFQSEFTHNAKHRTRFDAFVDGLNRLPRPLLAMGTISLFIYAMIEPQGFAVAMASLDLIPHEMWWLFGAIVSFFFGARELHYHRKDDNAPGTYSERAIETLQEIERLKALPTDKTPGIAASPDETVVRTILSDLDDEADNAAMETYRRQTGPARPRLNPTRRPWRGSPSVS